MEELHDFIKKAYDIESRAAYDYSFGVARIASYGYRVKELKEVINRIAVDTVLHKHLMKALLDSLDELERMNQSLSDIEERKVKAEEVPEEIKVLVKRFIERHLEIEKGMLELYSKIAEVSKNSVIKSIAESVAGNEEEHHSYLMELLNKI